jgi:6,7-dimethyl-8-ribityllumazine synthase
MNDHTDEPQDWPMRDSIRLRPPTGPPPVEGEDLGEAEVLYEEGEVEPTDERGPETIEAVESEATEAGPVEEIEAGEAEPVGEALEEPVLPTAVEEHAEGDFEVPGGYTVLEGAPNGNRRSVAIVVSRFNGEITNRLLESALSELEEAGVAQDAILVMPVPGAFELPIAAMALAKTRRYACVVALGCVIRGETPHFDYVASEAASGLQLAGIETGVPVSFGVLTCETAEQAEARVDRGAWAARSALEMADAFAQLRTTAAAR